MEDKLNNILDGLLSIKTYLIKIGAERRTGEQADERFKQAKDLYDEAVDFIKLINIKVEKSELGHKEIQLVNEKNSEIKDTYKSIVKLAPLKGSSRSPQAPVMAHFDLKTAISLLPMIDDTEEKTNQLIDAIDLYSGMLDTEGKKTLIEFVLKTRLSATAKLRLESKYDDVKTLIKSMKTHLLRNKSDTTLQVQLSKTKQGSKSIDQFGTELERLFVNLTISQANDDEAAYRILKPINEKNAIKRFIDGLNDQKISTIVNARNFSSLKDAIQTAVDEQSTSRNLATTDQQIYNFGRSRGRGRDSSKIFRGSNNYHRGQRHCYNSNYSRGGGNYSQNQQFYNNRGRPYYHNNNNETRGRMRGSHRSSTGVRDFTSGRRNRQQIFYANDETLRTEQINVEQNKFFRATEQ